MDVCPLCGKASPREKGVIGTKYKCPRCGVFDGSPDEIKRMLPHQLSIISHKVRRMQRIDNKPIIVNEEYFKQCLNDPLPNPQEAADSFISWLGDKQGGSFGSRVTLDIEEASAWIGLSVDDKPSKFFGWLFLDKEFSDLIEHDGTRVCGTAEPEIHVTSVRLTMAGWARYEALQRQRVDSRLAFMAMQFGDAELSGLVENHFKPAVKKAGFELRLLTDSQPAGLIDDQIRIRIRRAKFVIADLTHMNDGAYWEAGFAEGLGRRVIYTCRKEEWDARKTHFDTNHLVTVIWDPAEPEEAAKSLTNIIRASFPDEADLGDD